MGREIRKCIYLVLVWVAALTQPLTNHNRPMKYYVTSVWTIVSEKPAAYRAVFNSYQAALNYINKNQPGATGRNKYAQ